MQEEIIKRHNELVNDDDEVYFVGDFSFKFTTVEETMPLLKGKKFLIPGNHDKAWRLNNQLKERYRNFGVEVLDRIVELDIHGHKVVVSHLPYVNHDPRYQESLPIDKGVPLIHGHTHCKPENILFLTPKGTKCLDIGVRGHNYYPWSENEIIEVLFK